MESKSYKMHATIVKNEYEPSNTPYAVFLHSPEVNIDDQTEDYIWLGSFETFDAATNSLLNGIEIIEIKSK